MKKSGIPTRQQCFELIKQYCVPLHIQKHCFAVAGAAIFLAKKLKEKDVAVNTELVEAAALLHDLVRICDFEQLDYSQFEETVTEEDKTKLEQIRAAYKGYLHEDAAYEVLKDQYPAVALAIKKHKYTTIMDEATKPVSWEDKLLFYADMRVMHDQIVPLKQRLEDGHLRNAFLREKRQRHAGRCVDTERIDSLIFRLEKEIFGIAGLEPEDLIELSRDKA